MSTSNSNQKRGIFDAIGSVLDVTVNVVTDVAYVVSDATNVTENHMIKWSQTSELNAIAEIAEKQSEVMQRLDCNEEQLLQHLANFREYKRSRK